MHTFISRYEAQRKRIWPEVEAFFQNLPPSLRELGWSFAQRLARETSPTHEFKDAYKSPHMARIVYLPLWQIDAYLRRGISIPEVETLQAGLFASSFLGVCALRIHDDLIDGDKPHVHIDELLLANLFTIEAIRRLQWLFPSDSPLWDYHVQFWYDYTHAVRIDKHRDQMGLAPFDHTALRRIGDKGALLKTLPVAVALQAGRAHEIDQINAMMDAFNMGVQLANDLQSLRRDLESRHYTAPIAQAALSVGYEVGAHPPIDGLYGAIAVTDAVAEIHTVAIHCFERARLVSLELGINDLTDYLAWRMADLRESETRWRHIHTDKTHCRVEVDEDRLSVTAPEAPDSLSMALDFLQYGPECQEAWEFQRTGVWGQKLLIGDLFNRSLVIEVLAEQGRAASEIVEALLVQFQRNRWRYYRDFMSMPPDIDDIAQAVHLLCWAPWDAATKQQYLETPLRWLAANRAPDGGFPVWLTEEIDDQPESGWVPLVGTQCLACEANLLTALEEYDAPQTREWIIMGIESLLDRWETYSYNAVFYFAPAYAAFLMSRCFARLHSKPWISAEVARRLHRHLCGIVQDIVRSPLPESHWETPLRAASTVLTLLNGPEPPQSLIVKGLSVLGQQQEHDGGWACTGSTGLFCVPSRTGQRIAWHRSRLLTTAVVARALAQGRSWLSR